MPILGVVIVMGGLILVYLGFTGETLGGLMRTIFGP